MLHGAGIFTYISHQTLPKCSEIFHNWSIWVREVSRMMNCNTLAVQQYTEHAMLWGPAACWPMCACVKSCHYGLSEVCSLLARLPTIPCVKTVLQQFLLCISSQSQALPFTFSYVSYYPMLIWLVASTPLKNMKVRLDHHPNDRGK